VTETTIEHRNEVVLVGRITSPATERVLPSGDTITCWRVTVDRDGEGRDVVDCTAWLARLQRSSLAWQKGDVVEITGAIRRRFWRAGAGLGSATEVEVHAAKRLTSAATRPRNRE
jgi:single-strand DNA-binding protein